MLKKVGNEVFHLLTNRRFELRTPSYSQEGEDVFIRRYFKGKRRGHYVDVGAHHPKRISNTYLFYRMGWTGLNIDAMPGSMEAFNRLRPLDVNLEMGVAEEEGTLVYHIFDRPAFNTFSHAEAERKQQSGEHPVIDRKEISVAPLAQILEQHYPYDKIDFMSVDVEGLDLPVLRSNNWRVYRPQLVFAEDLKRTNLLELPASELVVFMQSVGYVPIARLYNTLVFERSR